MTVSRDGGPEDLTIMIDYYTEDGTANAESDYVAVRGTLTFAPDDRHQLIGIEIVDDDVFEEDEHFYLHLTNLRVRTKDGLILDPSRIGGVPVAMLEMPHTATIMILGRWCKNWVHIFCCWLSIRNARLYDLFLLVSPHLTSPTLSDDDHAGVFGFEHDHFQASRWRLICKHVFQASIFIVFRWSRIVAICSSKLHDRPAVVATLLCRSPRMTAPQSATSITRRARAASSLQTTQPSEYAKWAAVCELKFNIFVCAAAFRAFIEIGVVDTEQYERTDTFFVEIHQPVWSKNMSGELEE